MLTLERETTYKGIEYKIVEVLNSETLLVVQKDEYNSDSFPLQCYIIPGE